MATTITPGVRLAAPPATGRAGLPGALASEFTKLRSVRSTYWTLAALLIVSLGLDAAITAGQAAQFSRDPGNVAGFDATQASLGAFFEIGQLIIAVLGAMAITAEYSTGMIRTSLTAQPRRGVVYAAKAIVFAAVTLVISLVTSFIAFFLGQALIGHGAGASLFHTVRIHAYALGKCLSPAPGNNPGKGGPVGCAHAVMTFSGTDVITPGGVLVAIIATALFVTLVAIIAFGLGAIVRHTAGTISIVIAALFIIPILEHTLPDSWHFDIMRFLPDAANQVVSTTVGDPVQHLWSAWPQLGVTAVWAAALLGLGAWLFRQRDA